MWIGSNDFQWCEGLEEFLRITKNEYEEPPVLLSDEEYHLLFHDHHTWVIYGRYKATVMLPDGAVIYAHVRGTYVWRRIGDELRLAHVHGSHAQDIPLNQEPPERLTENSAFFDYMKRMDSMNRMDTDGDKLSFRDRTGVFHYPYAAEVRYLKANNQGCIVSTTKEELDVNGLLAVHMEDLPPQFQRIHKSYVVNISHIASICRYHATLSDGTKLPISKERYMGLKRTLQEQPSMTPVL